MPLGNREGWRRDEAEPEELPDYFYTMPAKDSQRIQDAFLSWAEKRLLLYFAGNKEAAAAYFIYYNLNEVKLMNKKLQMKIVLSILLAGAFTGSAWVQPGQAYAEKRITGGIYEEDVFAQQQSVNSKEKVTLTDARLIIEGGEIKSKFDSRYREYVNGNAYAAHLQNVGTGGIEMRNDTLWMSGGKVEGEAVAAWGSGKGDLLLAGNEARLTGGSAAAVYAAQAFNPDEREVVLRDNRLKLQGTPEARAEIGTGAAALVNYANGGTLTLTGNQTSVSNALVGSHLYGGNIAAFDRKAAQVTASGNGVELTDTQTAGSGNIYGVNVQQDKKRFEHIAADGNSASLSGRMQGSANIIYGAKVAEAVTGSANNNKVAISVSSKYVVDAAIGARIDGGSKDGHSELEASGNQVYVSGGADKEHELLVRGSTGGGSQGGITGGRVYTAADTDAARANRNVVTIGSFVGNKNGTINYGGRVDGYGTAKVAEANGNKVSVGADNRLAVLYGGSASGASAAADGNVLTIASSGVGGIYGGSASGTDKVSASGNQITMSNDRENLRSSSITGGKAKATGTGEAVADNNILRLDGTEFTLLTAAGIADSAAGSAQSNGNRLLVSGKADFDVEVYGGKASSSSGTATADKNGIVIESGDFNLRNFSFIPGGLSAGAARNGTGQALTRDNFIVIQGGDITAGGEWKGTAYPSFINGGRAVAGSGDAEASNNSVAVSGGTIKLTNRYDADHKAQFTSDLSGGHVESGGKAVAVNNKVAISGGTLIGDIYGAYAKGSSAEITHNSVSVQGKADLSLASLYGYKAEVQDKSLQAADNTLHVDGWQGAVQRVANFDKITLDNTVIGKDGKVLCIAAAQADDLKNAQVNFNSLAGGQDLSKVKTIRLLDSGQQLGIAKTEFKEYVPAGVGLMVRGEADTSAGGLSFKVKEVKTSKQADNVAAGRAVSAAFLNQGGDLIADSLDRLSLAEEEGVQTFAAVQGNRSKYDVNSDLKINGWNSIVGVGSKGEAADSVYSWGIFYENGSGNYRTHNEFNNGFFRSDGSLVYNGGGIAARWQRDNGVYAEGSLRAGTLKNEAGSSLQDSAGQAYGYKTSGSYYGAHVGVGKVISLNEATDLDVYGKFFHTYTDGDSLTVAGDKFEFDSITSDRLRIGARVTTNKENKFSTYYGLACEYEFNGDADLRVQNVAAPRQSLQGSSYMAEIGMNYQPGSDSPWSFDLNMRGYAGERDGFSGSVQATYSF